MGNRRRQRDGVDAEPRRGTGSDPSTCLHPTIILVVFCVVIVVGGRIHAVPACCLLMGLSGPPLCGYGFLWHVYGVEYTLTFLSSKLTFLSSREGCVYRNPWPPVHSAFLTTGRAARAAIPQSKL